MIVATRATVGALLALSLWACGKSADVSASAAEETSTAAEPSSVVGEFLRWYVILADTSRVPAWGAAVQARPALFEDTLRAELASDAFAQGQLIDGLDWDPFLNSQDPCERYTVGVGIAGGDTLDLPIFATCEGQPRPNPVATFRLVRRDRKWRIKDVLGTDGSELVEQLRIMRIAREMRSDSLAPPNDGW